MRRLFRRFVFYFRMFFFDPQEMFNKLRGLPYFLDNIMTYRRLHQGSRFRLRLRNLYYVSYDRFTTAGVAGGHYFWQDLWAAQYLYEGGVREHIDVGSRVDGFITHLLVFSRVTYIDLRSLAINVKDLYFKKGNITALPFADSSVKSLSCLHVLEHIGLGRYGDSIDPDGYLKAARELSRILAEGGILLVSVPVGREYLYFDGHRMFDPTTIIEVFSGLSLLEFSLIDDKGDRIIRNASFEAARSCIYGCGLFVFTKK